MKRWLLIVMVGGFLGLTSCAAWTTIQGVTPIYPKAWQSIGGVPASVSSLQPTFRWEAATESDAQYDFIMYESHKIQGDWAIGREVYYRQGLNKPEHALGIVLQPNTAYYWSVRIRHREGVTPWSAFVYNVAAIGGGGSAIRYPFFIFETPEK
jgi:hypothetical protein